MCAGIQLRSRICLTQLHSASGVIVADSRCAARPQAITTVWRGGRVFMLPWPAQPRRAPRDSRLILGRREVTRLSGIPDNEKATDGWVRSSERRTTNSYYSVCDCRPRGSTVTNTASIRAKVFGSSHFRTQRFFCGIVLVENAQIDSLLAVRATPAPGLKCTRSFYFGLLIEIVGIENQRLAARIEDSTVCPLRSCFVASPARRLLSSWVSVAFNSSISADCRASCRRRSVIILSR